MKNSKSIVFKRQQNLLRYLQEKKEIDIDGAARRLGVSPTTVRRDLMMFEHQRLITRFHGGARLLEDTLKEEDTPTTDKKMRIDYDQKRVIARYAADLVDDGDTIFINSSSTALLMLDFLKDKHVNVITNNASAIYRPHAPSVSVILTGGELYARRQSLVGEFALQTIARINADKAFIGVGAISVKGGITTSVLPETAVNELMMRRSYGKTYIVTANTKIGKEHNFLSSSIDKVEHLITCAGGDAKEIERMRAAGIDIVELPIEAF